MRNSPELLSPAGDLERLCYAVVYGADAVYCGMKEFGMRSAPLNFTADQIKEGCRFAHDRNARVYLTLNTLPTNEEMDRLPAAIEAAADAGVDAFIVADLGVLALCKKMAPKVEIHFSTQVGIANYLSACQAYEMGAKRVVLARELTLEDIHEIRVRTPKELELEAFIHGAMCMSISGRCLLSSYLTGRDGNRGQCAQPCRWKYYLVEETRPGQYMEIGESKEGSYILNARDMCTAEFLDRICKAGVDSLKIEGRAKTAYYVASVTAAYRRALNSFLAAPDVYHIPEETVKELSRTSHREYSPGFYLGKDKAVQSEKSGYIREWEFIGVVEKWQDGIACCTQRGKFSLGETIEILTPSGQQITICPEWIRDENEAMIESTPHAMMRYSIPCKEVLPQMSLIRKKV